MRLSVYKGSTAIPGRDRRVARGGGTNKNNQKNRWLERGSPREKELETLVNLHMIIGLATLAAFVLLAIVNGLRAFRGAEMNWARGLSFAAAGLLIIQYVIGFGLLSSDHKMKAIHYILALAAIIPVGAEHMVAAQEPDPRRARRTAFICNVITAAILVVVYAIGERNGS